MNISPREVFLKGCNEITEPLIKKGFKTTQKGQTVLYRPNKDVTLEIYFQSSFRNYENSITIIPHIRVLSKAVKEFDKVAYSNPDCTGFVAGHQLCYMLNSKYKVWNLAKENYAPTVSQIQNAIVEVVLPFFDIFRQSPGKVIECSIEQRIDISVSYALIFGGKALAEKVLKNRIDQLNYKERCMELYRSLFDMNKEDIDPKYNEFIGAGVIKMAYLQGLRLE